MQVGELRAEARGEAGRVDAAEAETGEDAAGVVDAAGVAGITPVEIGQPLALLHRTEGVDLRRIGDVIVHVDRAADALFVRLPQRCTGFGTASVGFAAWNATASGR